MTKRHTVIYSALAIICAVAYPMGRSVMIHQEPFGYLIVSNFILNYLFMFLLAGAASPWLAARIPMLTRFRPATRSGIVMITLVSALLIVLTLAGMQMRWS